MKFNEAKSKFIQTWGALGSQWGINKTMAQIHALLMISPDPLSMEDVMEELQISRGNTSMNLRALMDWGIVFKEYKPGERKEFFSAEGNIDELLISVIEENEKLRKKVISLIIGKEESKRKEEFLNNKLKQREEICEKREAEIFSLRKELNQVNKSWKSYQTLNTILNTQIPQHNKTEIGFKGESSSSKKNANE